MTIKTRYLLTGFCAFILLLVGIMTITIGYKQGISYNKNWQQTSCVVMDKHISNQTCVINNFRQVCYSGVLNMEYLVGKTLYRSQFIFPNTTDRNVANNDIQPYHAGQVVTCYYDAMKHNKLMLHLLRTSGYLVASLILFGLFSLLMAIMFGMCLSEYCKKENELILSQSYSPFYGYV